MQPPKRPAPFNYNAAPADIPAELDRWEYDMRDYAMDMAAATQAVLTTAGPDPIELAAKLSALWSEANRPHSDMLECSCEGDRLVVRNDGSYDGMDLAYSDGQWRLAGTESDVAPEQLGATLVSYVYWGNEDDVVSMRAAITQTLAEQGTTAASNPTPTLDYPTITTLLAAHKPTLELTDYGALTHRGAAGCLGPQLCETSATGETYAAQFVMWRPSVRDGATTELLEELLERFADHWPAWCDKNGFVIWHAGQSFFSRTDCPFHDPTNEVAVIWRSVASNEDAAAALIALLATPAWWPEENLAFL